LNKSNSYKYLVFTQKGFDRTSGGVIALHKLCHDLRALGEDAYISHGPGCYTLNTPLYIPNLKELKNDFIVVYPEVVLGNPLNCPRVVRWILNTPGAFGETTFYKEEQKTDLIYKISSNFDYSGIGVRMGILSTLYTDYSIYKNYGYSRNGSCYLIKKGKVKEKFHDETSLHLDVSADWESIALIFNTKSIFYCYDTASYWSALAALCGCVCLVIPDGEKSATEWHKYFPHFDYGVAYGTDELEFATQTINKVSDHIKALENNNLKSVQRFINMNKSYYGSRKVALILYIEYAFKSPLKRKTNNIKSDLKWWIKNWRTRLGATVKKVTTFEKS